MKTMNLILLILVLALGLFISGCAIIAQTHNYIFGGVLIAFAVFSLAYCGKRIDKATHVNNYYANRKTWEP